MSLDGSPTPIDLRAPSVRSTLDRGFWRATGIASLAALIGTGLLAAIIPNPVFGRPIAADPFAVAVWIASAPLLGALIATYITLPADGPTAPERDAGMGRVTLGGIAVFFAIGCPVCNKLILVTLGTSGALNLFAPIQPLIGVASLALLAATLAWRLRRRAAGCALPKAGLPS